MDTNRFKESPFMGILRGVEEDTIEPLVETIISSGLKTIEITMNTLSAPKLIKKAVKVAGGRFTIGAGTVLTTDETKLAIDCGATFIVSPVLIRDVVDYCVKTKIPVFPGAFTPQEIYAAWQRGATMVKVFPAKFFGPDYFKEIKGPFEDIELLACGGVNKDNISSFFSSGASAIAFGASVFKKDWLSSGKFTEIKDTIETLIANSRKSSPKINMKFSS